tara:strand:- start:17135 stop:17251 length:117 start_codon:yes stop_codon:yes gene_type:complete
MGEKNMNKNYYIDDLLKRVQSLEKRLAIIEELLSGKNK